jgi:hypothetical protein
LAAVSDKGGNQQNQYAHIRGPGLMLIFVKPYNLGAKNKKNKIPHRAITELLMNENEGRVVDFMTIDVEGAEFPIMKVLHCRSISIYICY